jgi:hypothetical protein
MFYQQRQAALAQQQGGQQGSGLIMPDGSRVQ